HNAERHCARIGAPQGTNGAWRQLASVDRGKAAGSPRAEPLAQLANVEAGALVPAAAHRDPKASRWARLRSQPFLGTHRMLTQSLRRRFCGGEEAAPFALFNRKILTNQSRASGHVCTETVTRGSAVGTAGKIHHLRESSVDDTVGHRHSSHVQPKGDNHVCARERAPARLSIL